jgi:hypothetical protein
MRRGNWIACPALAAELVRLKADIIVTTGPTVTRSAKQATQTIPICDGHHGLRPGEVGSGE